ncbi:hypothetical protein [Candidatus Solirubrobacter pratensis]|nr:hypothetical protein [Candidatus Solirubrobacter pratensis]
MNSSLVHLPVLATTVRRPASHAFVVPVVRELPAQSMRVSAGSAW